MDTIRYITEPAHARPLSICLPNQDRRTFAPYLHTQHYRRGAFLFHVGERAGQLFWVCQGIMKISTPTVEGSERLLNIFWPGDIFGMEFVSHDQRQVSIAQAISPVTVRTTTDAGLTELLRLSPNLYTDLL